MRNNDHERQYLDNVSSQSIIFVFHVLTSSGPCQIRSFKPSIIPYHLSWAKSSIIPYHLPWGEGEGYNKVLWREFKLRKLCEQSAAVIIAILINLIPYCRCYCRCYFWSCELASSHLFPHYLFRNASQHIQESRCICICWSSQCRLHHSGTGWIDIHRNLNEILNVTNHGSKSSVSVSDCCRQGCHIFMLKAQINFNNINWQLWKRGVTPRTKTRHSSKL